MKIRRLQARQVLDSRGSPTVEVEISLDNKGWGRFITPSGASCGSKEALELRDNDANIFNGRGVSKAVSNINTLINSALSNKEINSQAELDNLLIELDGTPNKSHLGANAILAVSAAFMHACSSGEGKPLYRYLNKDRFIMPMPLVNVINGGAHANNNLDIQEFMLVPVSANSFSTALRMCAEIFYALKKDLSAIPMSTSVGDEGGFAPALKNNEQALELLEKAVINAGYKPAVDIKFALDVAANELYDVNECKYRIENKLLDTDSMLSWYKDLTAKFPICSIEDPFYEDDHQAFSLITSELGSKIQIVGDDLFVTNERLIAEGIKNKYANSVLIKMNQIGTITETLKAINLAKNSNFTTIISHRSGDSEDTTIADLAVMTNAGQIKTGSMCRSERVAKYNRLIKIEDELGSAAKINGDLRWTEI